MRALKFRLSGKSAFFKKPEVNTYYYFTFGQIHKVALMGMFGAILGYGGYSQKVWKSKKKKAEMLKEMPEFYEKLKDVKVSIIPQNEKGYIPKKVQIFNNSVGYASKELGGNLIVKEQWLENPEWIIYILLDGEEAEKIAEAVLNFKCVYFPYLGKNDHPADITNAVLVNLELAGQKESELSCLFPKDIGELIMPDEDDNIQEYKYEENLPVDMDEWLNQYMYRIFCFTNLSVRHGKEIVFKDADKNIVFY